VDCLLEIISARATTDEIHNGSEDIKTSKSHQHQVERGEKKFTSKFKIHFHPLRNQRGLIKLTTTNEDMLESKKGGEKEQRPCKIPFPTLE
jgi:hypothetical protein